MNNEIILFSPDKNLEDLYKAKKFALLNNFTLALCTKFEELTQYVLLNRIIVCNNYTKQIKDYMQDLPTEIKLNIFDILEINTIPPYNFDNNLYKIELFLTKKDIPLCEFSGMIIKRILFSMLSGNIEKISNKYYIFYCETIGIDYNYCSLKIRKYIKKDKSIISFFNSLYIALKNE